MEFIPIERPIFDKIVKIIEEHRLYVSLTMGKEISEVLDYLSELKAQSIVDKFNQNIPKYCIKEASKLYEVTEDEILSKSRKKEIVEARQYAMWRMRNLSDMSYTKIADVFQKNHATVIHACTTIDNRIHYNQLLFQLNKKLESKYKTIRIRVIYVYKTKNDIKRFYTIKQAAKYIHTDPVYLSKRLRANLPIKGYKFYVRYERIKNKVNYNN